MRILQGEAINNRHYLSLFYFCHIFPQRRHGIIIRPLVVPKICCVSRLDSWRNILDPVSQRQMVMRMKVESNKGISPDFVRNVLNDCKDDCDYISLGYLDMNLPPRHLQDLPCLSLILIFLEFIIRFIEISCPRILLHNLDTLLYKNCKALSDIHIRLESIICGIYPPLR